MPVWQRRLVLRRRWSVKTRCWSHGHAANRAERSRETATWQISGASRIYKHSHATWIYPPPPPPPPHSEGFQGSVHVPSYERSSTTLHSMLSDSLHSTHYFFRSRPHLFYVFFLNSSNDDVIFLWDRRPIIRSIDSTTRWNDSNRSQKVEREVTESCVEFINTNSNARARIFVFRMSGVIWYEFFISKIFIFRSETCHDIDLKFFIIFELPYVYVKKKSSSFLTFVGVNFFKVILKLWN